MSRNRLLLLEGDRVSSSRYRRLNAGRDWGTSPPLLLLLLLLLLLPTAWFGLLRWLLRLVDFDDDFVADGVGILGVFRLGRENEVIQRDSFVPNSGTSAPRSGVFVLCSSCVYLNSSINEETTQYPFFVDKEMMIMIMIYTNIDEKKSPYLLPVRVLGVRH